MELSQNFSTMIIIPNIDGKIWNIEQHTIDIVDCIINHRQIQITLNGEGPDARELGLYSLLDNICNRYSYSKNSITIITCNQLESHSEYCIRIQPPLYIASAQKFASQTQLPEKTFGNEFKHFGLFVGRSNWLRLWLASYLHKNYVDKTALTFHYDSTLDFHQDHLGLDDLVRFNTAQIKDLDPMQLIAKCPIVDQTVESYPILTPAHFNISKIYHTFFLEVVCETYCRGNSFYPTEKTWRPIINRTPFIIQGPRNFTKNLQRLGFKTFSNWFDESHGQDEYSYQPTGICATLDRLATFSISELEGMYIDMSDTLNHNYQVMMSLTDANVTKIFK
jgi:hypothetical protein